MTFTFTAVVKATAAKFNFAACCRHAKCSFRVRLHTKVFCVPHLCVLFAALFQLEPSPFAFRTFFRQKKITT
jgi:hypothetical protein